MRALSQKIEEPIKLHKDIQEEVDLHGFLLASSHRCKQNKKLQQFHEKQIVQSIYITSCCI